MSFKVQSSLSASLSFFRPLFLSLSQPDACRCIHTHVHKESTRLHGSTCNGKHNQRNAHPNTFFRGDRRELREKIEQTLKECDF